MTTRPQLSTGIMDLSMLKTMVRILLFLYGKIMVFISNLSRAPNLYLIVGYKFIEPWSSLLLSWFLSYALMKDEGPWQNTYFLLPFHIGWARLVCSKPKPMF
jgi:hypothetical protein